MGKERREYAQIVEAVLDSLEERQKSVNEIAVELKTGWDTVERCLSMLEKLHYTEKIIDEPVTIYKRNHVINISDKLKENLDRIISRKGARYLSIEEAVEEALEEFIRRERSIKRY